MKYLFKKIPVQLPKPLSLKEKQQSLLHDTGGDWYMKNIKDKLPPLNKRKPSKKSQEKEYEIKRHLNMLNQSCNDWEFQIHWNKLEWFNPRSFIKIKNNFWVSSRKFGLEDNNKTAHWVGHSKLKPLHL